jgi:uncharacterized protein
MNVTEKLFKLFQVDKQLRGLQSRLKAAERFLDEQSSGIQQIDTKRGALESQLRQITASAMERESEAKRLEARMNVIRDQMNSATTNKDYKAFLAELNNLKTEKDKVEQEALDQMGKCEDLKKQVADLTAKREEREKVQVVARSDRDKRAEEIKDRLAELQTQRAALTADLPKDPLHTFENLIRARGDDAMAPIEIQDRKRHEFSCGACMIMIPVETVSKLMGAGKLTTCVSCGCVLYISPEDAKALLPAESKR